MWFNIYSNFPTTKLTPIPQSFKPFIQQPQSLRNKPINRLDKKIVIRNPHQLVTVSYEIIFFREYFRVDQSKAKNPSNSHLLSPGTSTMQMHEFPHITTDAPPLANISKNHVPTPKIFTFPLTSWIMTLSNKTRFPNCDQLVSNYKLFRAP